MIPACWDEAKATLCKRDKTFKMLINAYDGEIMTIRGDAFFTLARSIAGQQISVKAADTVWKRTATAVGKMTPKNMIATSSETLRSCGLSANKVIYMHALANHFLENKKTIKNWPSMSDDELIKELTSIKGIGRWSAEMFLIFGLGRPDVFPVGDLGMLKSIYRHYNNSEKMPLDEVRALGERWKPYRSVATWYLWRALDPVPVAY